MPGSSGDKRFPQSRAGLRRTAKQLQHAELRSNTSTWFFKNFDYQGRFSVARCHSNTLHFDQETRNSCCQKREALMLIEVQRHHQLAKPQFVPIAHDVPLVGANRLAVEKGAVGAPQVGDLQHVIRKAQGRV